MSDSLPIWRVFNYLAKTWYDMPTRELDAWDKWYVPAIDLVWSMANAQEKERRETFRPVSVAAKFDENCRALHRAALMAGGGNATQA